ncbi:MAG: DNA-directed RNA polymerase subunit alpha [Deltaproteobacteria bacterium]|nr:DNA-directed RNA polymerase subunit alpha [Deltaproteobacteria bacterium]NIS76996.1 DNA-directed RNA polymerase subunit alpha [Deltaproteobacteria bacterium]
MFQRNWKELIKPKRVNIDAQSATGYYGKFVAEPLERGFGTTIGNALRRILLSSLQGAAIVSLSVEGVQHEFSSIQGVVEDVTDIILNLKGVQLRTSSHEPRTGSIDVKGPKKVTAGDIVTDHHVEIINKDHHIAEVLEGGSLKIELTMRMGKGYMAAEKNIEEDLPIGTIPIDAIFSPIKRVNFDVTNARVGQQTDYDRLIIEIWTDGSLLPADAVAYAARILQDQLVIFINFEEPEEEEHEAVEEEIKDDEFSEKLYRTIDELELSVRAYNCLKNANIKYIGKLVQKTEQEMLKTKNFGKKSLNEIKQVLEEMGLYLGMKVDNFKVEEDKKIEVPKEE